MNTQAAASAFTAVVADDEAHLARHLVEQLAALWPALKVVATAANGVEAAAAIERLEPDIAFLDIRMPGLSGLEVAQGIEGDTRVVFVTAHDEYAIEAFDREALDYLLKPLTGERLARTVERLQRRLSDTLGDRGDARLARLLQQLRPDAVLQAPLRYVRASQGGLTHQIPIEEVMFFRALHKYTCVQTADGEHLIRTAIAELAPQLDASQFWQIHRSTLVNLRYLAGTRRNEASRLFVRIKGYAQELPVSRAYVHLFKAM